MILLLTVKQQIIKSLVTELIENKIKFEMNTSHHSLRINNVRRWMYLTNTETFSIYFDNYYMQPGIHKDNIEQVCISDKT